MVARDLVFISYRRDDCRGEAGRLASDLKRHFGEERVFFDTESIDPGQKFPQRIRTALASARVVLVIMGGRWLKALDEHQRRRIDDPKDWVHREVAAALESEEVTVIPVCVDVEMPSCEALPQQLARLSERNALALTHDQFKQQVKVIVECIANQGVQLASSYDAIPEATSVDVAALACYRTSVEAEHATLELAGFHTRLRARIELEELHVPLRAMVDLRGNGEAEFADAEHAASCLHGARGAHEIALSEAFLEAEARRARGLVILGDPGSGKTTQLKRLLLWLLRRGGEEIGLGRGESPVPVFIRLRELRDARAGLETFIERQLASVHPDLPRGFGLALLRRGELLLLFDGLDEIADPEQRGTVARGIEALLRQRRNCRAVVTCRFAGYGGTARLNAQFLELHVQPLEREQAEQFIRNWYRVVETGLAQSLEQGKSVADQQAAELIERLREPDFRGARLVQMTRNPLLLANLCLVHRDSGKLPKQRARLYAECIEVLLERWREGKQLSVAVTSEVGQRALQPAALWLHGLLQRSSKACGSLGADDLPALFDVAEMLA